MPPRGQRNSPTATEPSKPPRADGDVDVDAVAIQSASGDNDPRLAAWQERCERLENLVKELRPGLNVEPIVGPRPGTTDTFDYDTWTRSLRALDIPPLPAFRTLENLASVPQQATLHTLEDVASVGPQATSPTLEDVATELPREPPYDEFRTLAMFPHLIDKILSYATPTALIALRAASRGLCVYVDTRLAHHLVLEVRDSKTLLEVRDSKAREPCQQYEALCISLQPIGCFDPSLPRLAPKFSQGVVSEYSPMQAPFHPRFSQCRMVHIGPCNNTFRRIHPTVAQLDKGAIPYLQRTRVVDLVQNSKESQHVHLNFLNPLTEHLSEVEVMRIRRASGYINCPIKPATLICFGYRRHFRGCGITTETEKVVLVLAVNHTEGERSLWGCATGRIKIPPSRIMKELVIIMHEVHSSEPVERDNNDRRRSEPLRGMFHDLFFNAPHIKLTIVGPDLDNPKGMDCAAEWMRAVPALFVKAVAHKKPDFQQAAQAYIDKARLMTFDEYRSDVGDEQFELEMMAEDWMPHDHLGECPGRPRQESV